MKKIISALLTTVVASCGALAKTTAITIDQENLPHAYEVVEGQVLRGAQPTSIGLKELAAAHVKTIIDLREETDWIQKEKIEVQALGMNFISVPLSAFHTPSDQDMDLIEGALTRADLWPVFIHCEHGRDRTGLAIGLFQVFAQGMSPQNAYVEMKQLGFRSILFSLKNYFDKKTQSTYSDE